MQSQFGIKEGQRIIKRRQRNASIRSLPGPGLLTIEKSAKIITWNLYTLSKYHKIVLFGTWKTKGKFTFHLFTQFQSISLGSMNWINHGEIWRANNALCESTENYIVNTAPKKSEVSQGRNSFWSIHLQPRMLPSQVLFMAKPHQFLSSELFCEATLLTEGSHPFGFWQKGSQG